MANIKEIENTYRVTDYVTGGDLGRSRNAEYELQSVWSKDLNLISLHVDNEDFTEYAVSNFLRPGLDDFHKNRAIRGRNRHLKLLKEHLGLALKVLPAKKTFIYEEYRDWPLKINPLSLTQEGKPNMHEVGRRRCWIVEATDVKLQLAEEYNTKLEEWNKYRKALLNKIFEVASVKTD